MAATPQTQLRDVTRTVVPVAGGETGTAPEGGQA